jgi:hypothetical protein
MQESYLKCHDYFCDRVPPTKIMIVICFFQNQPWVCIIKTAYFILILILKVRVHYISEANLKCKDLHSSNAQL